MYMYFGQIACMLSVKFSIGYCPHLNKPPFYLYLVCVFERSRFVLLRKRSRKKLSIISPGLNSILGFGRQEEVILSYCCPLQGQALLQHTQSFLLAPLACTPACFRSALFQYLLSLSDTIIITRDQLRFPSDVPCYYCDSTFAAIIHSVNLEHKSCHKNVLRGHQNSF